MTRPGAPADVEESHGRCGGGTTPPRSCVVPDAAACLRPLTDDPYEYRDEVESAEDDLDFAFPLNDEDNNNDDDAGASPRDVGKVEDMRGPVLPHVEDEEDTDASLSLVGLFIENVAVLSLPYLAFA